MATAAEAAGERILQGQGRGRREGKLGGDSGVDSTLYMCTYRVE